MNELPENRAGPAADLAALLEEALALQGRGEPGSAETLFMAILSRDPRHFVANHQLGVIQIQRGSFIEAERTLGTTVEINPRSATAHLNLGIALYNQNRTAEALDHFQLSLIINPRNAEALLNLGIVLQELRRPQEALARLDLAVRIPPVPAKAHLIRGIALQSLHRHLEALDSFDQALAIQPGNADAHSCRGASLQALGKPGEALAALDRALALEPAHADAHLNRAAVLLGLDRAEEALASIDQSIALKPDQADAHMNRGNALRQLRRLSEALAEYDRSLALQPQQADALLNRGMALHLLGRHPEAIASCDQVLALQPDRSAAHSAKIFMLDFLPDLTFQRHQEERRNYFEAHCAGLMPASQSHPNDRDLDRRLVLGYVSADFKRHSASSCFGPVLRNHDKSRFQIHCYSGVVVEDDVTAQFRGCADRWIQAAGLSDDQLAERIRQDRVDILIDLSGHSMGNRLPVFARKPAPVQVTAWGHGGGTGLPAIDFMFTDPVHIPVWARPLFAEVACDLPCNITFEAPPDSPPVSALPALTNGFVTFGSLNRFSKVTPALLDLWAGILFSIPSSRLIIKDFALDDPAVRSHITALFRSRGVEPERMELRGSSSQRDHLATYNDIDIALDSFPQNGGITTWEALWMGVPVATMLGNHPACRLSGAILEALDLGGWVSRDEPDIRAVILAQADRINDLGQLRSGLRARIAASPAGNPRIYTQAVETAYRAMWKDWACR